MNHRLRFWPVILLVVAFAPEIRAQTNIYSFTANDGIFYPRIKIIRVESDCVFYTYTQGTGGGRLKFSQLPETMAEELKAYKPREKTFADSVPASAAKTGNTEMASSNRTGGGAKSDSATLGLTNNTAHAICTFSRMISTNGADYRIAVIYYGTNYLGLGGSDSLTFDADGTLVTYSPVPGTHEASAGGNEMSETQVYNSSLRDLEKICSAQTLGVALSGPLGNDNFSVPPATILKTFGRYCLTNSAATTPKPGMIAIQGTKAVNSEPAQPVPQEPAEVLNATAKAVDTDAYTTQWAWKVTLHASPAPPKDFLVEIQFLDADGFVLAHEVEYPVKLNAGETNTLTGQSAIKTALSGRIKTCKVVMK